MLAVSFGTAEAAAVPEAKKNFTDSNGKTATLKKDQFEFELLDEDGKVVATAKNAASASSPRISANRFAEFSAT